MKASILICTHNRERQIRETLNTLARVQIPDGLDVECIVIANASPDSMLQTIQSCSLPGMELKCVYEPVPGTANARNRSLKEATGEILLCLDDDMNAPVEWLHDMTTPLLEGRADVAGGAVRLNPELERSWMDDYLRGFLCQTNPTQARSKFPVTGNMAFVRKVLERVPAFDPELGPGALGACEDMLFGKQLDAAGYRFTVLFERPGIHNLEPRRLQRESFVRRAREEGRSRAYVTYHWSHSEPRWPLLRALAQRARLARLRWTESWPHAEALSPREMRTLVKLDFHLGILRERKRPRQYTRCGLTKLSGNAELQLRTS